MAKESGFGPIHTFNPRNFAQDLRLEPGHEYVEGDTVDQIRAALEAGYAVFAESCDGKAFVWPGEEAYLADRFYQGPARTHTFRTIDEAADFAASLCE
jgi:hypothetical protein